MQKILYFVMGNPTKKQEKEASSMGAVIRNAEAWHDGDFIEQCDAVAGEIPDAYTALPRAGTQPAAQGSAAQQTQAPHAPAAQVSAVVTK